MRRWVLGLLSAAGAVLLLLAWCRRPLDPNTWHAFARSANSTELAQLVSGGQEDRATVERWSQYLLALKAGDDEAFEVARRLCPVIGSAAHPSEQFVGALGLSLERRPADVLELVQRCFPGSTVCQWFGEDSEPTTMKASIGRRRAAVSALLDGGLSAAARECLQELH